MSEAASLRPHPDWWQWPLNLDGSLTQPTALAEPAPVGPAVGAAAQLAVLEDLGLSGQVRMRRCVQGALGRRVLVLEAAQDAESLAAIGRSLAAIGHPGVQRIHDGAEGLLICADGDGEDMASAWAAGRLDLRQAVQACAEVAEALAQVHAGGLVHRDIKPSAIHLGRYGEVVLIGWGCAVANPQAAQPLARAPQLSGQRLVMGSPAWMAPEQARGEAHRMGPAQDVYGLGACLYFLLYGRVPHSGSAAEALEAAAAGALELPPLADPAASALRSVAATFLDDDPAARPTASAAATALRDWLRQAQRIAELGELLASRPADLPATLDALDRIEGRRDCWPALDGLAPRRRALASQALDLALAGGDLELGQALAAGWAEDLILPASAARLAAALAAQRRRQRMQGMASRIALAAILLLAFSLGLSVWLQYSHHERLQRERSARAEELRQQVDGRLAAEPQDLAHWQALLAAAWQAHALDAPASAALVDRSSAQAMDWALDAGQPGLAQAWGLAQRAQRGGSALDQRLAAAAAAAMDRQQRLAELDAELDALAANPLSPWRPDWFASLAQRLGEWDLPDLAERLPRLQQHDAVPLLRLLAELGAGRPELLPDSQLQKLLAHPHPAVVDAAWQAAARRQAPQALPLLVAGIRRPEDLQIAADRAQALGPWARQALADLPAGRERALLALVLDGDGPAYLDLGRDQAMPATWPLYGQVAWALGDRQALADWLSRGDERALNPAQRALAAALAAEPGPEPWAQWLAHRLQPDADLPAAGAVGEGDLDLWWGSLPYVASQLAAAGQQSAADLAAARANLQLVGWDHLIAEARRRHRSDRLPALLALRRLWSVEGVP